jgi:hypothetical protein
MRRLVLLTALAAALATAGCDRAATTASRNGLVSISVRDYRYDHQSVRVRRGPVTFSITNAGREPTNFRIRRRKRALASIATLAPGEQGVTTARLKPGTYVMYSSVGHHEALGEYGELVVTR